MEGSGIKSSLTSQLWFDEESGNIDEFIAQTSRSTIPEQWPLAAQVDQNVLIYDGAKIDAMADTPSGSREIMLEWCRAFSNDGPGVIAVKGAYRDLRTIDRASEIFLEIIAREKEQGAAASDHFAAAGANDRIWNSLEKHSIADPEGFADYFASATISLASKAWLGPGYQVTAQVNLVHPGGKAQFPHRDYHMGFMETARMAQFPAHAHDISPVLTLQGAIAHCDMAVESGTTMLLPYSQKFREGYLAYSREPFQKHFAENYVQLPLEKGDIVFFNPALMHGAGNNKTTHIERLVNLLQVGSAFGRSIETVNRDKLSRAIYPVLLERKQSGDPTKGDVAGNLARVIASTAEGYAFPTNLDTDPPVDGLNPKSMQMIMAEALEGDCPAEEFSTLMDAYLLRHG